MGLEKSPELADFAERKLNSKIINDDFEHYNFSNHSVSGILLVASLVHVPHKKLNGVLKGILRAANQFTIVFISLKEGVGAKKDNEGRVNYYWQHTDLKALFKNLGLSILEFQKKDSSLNTGDIFLSYVLKFPL